MRGTLLASLTITIGLIAVGGSPSTRADDPDPGAKAPAGTAEHPGEEDTAPGPLLDRIEAAIPKGVAWLRKRQLRDGSFGNLRTDVPTYSGSSDGYDEPYGPTGLAVYTLLKCEVPASDPAVTRGFDFLRRHRTEGHAYEVAATLLAVTATADPFKKSKDSVAAADKTKLVGEWRTWANDLVARLGALQSPRGWRYWGPRDPEEAGGREDTSSTQYVALALLAADRCGIAIPPGLWHGAIQFVLEQQETTGPPHPRAVHPRPGPAKAGPPKPGETVAPSPPGDLPVEDRARGFCYTRKAVDGRDRAATGAMTACGVGTLMMARYALANRAPKEWAKENAARIQTGIYDGLAWLDDNWRPFQNPESGHYHIYYLYCVERTMDLVGSQRLGSHFWYAEMAEVLLENQAEDGSWNTKSTLAQSPLLDTCFALLFLHRATRGGIPFPTVTGGSDVPPSDRR